MQELGANGASIVRGERRPCIRTADWSTLTVPGWPKWKSQLRQGNQHMSSFPLSRYWSARWLCLLIFFGSGCSETGPHVNDLTHEDPEVRLSAAVALGKLGPDARSAVPALIGALRDSDEVDAFRVRFAIVDALASIGTAAVPDLIELLQDRDRGVRSSAVVALRGIGSDAKEAVPYLIRALENAASLKGPISYALPHYVAKALGQIGPDARAAIPNLKTLLGHPSWRVVVSAAGALAVMKQDGGYSEDESQKLIEILVPEIGEEREEDDGYIEFSVAALGPVAVPALCNALMQAHTSVDKGAQARLLMEATTIFHVMADGDPATLNDSMPCLLRAVIRTNNKPVTAVIVSTIGVLIGTPAVPAIMAFLQTEWKSPPDWDRSLLRTQGLVARILINMAQISADNIDPVLDGIHESIKTSDDRFKSIAIMVLANLAPESERVVEILEEELASETRPEIRKKIQSSLKFAETSTWF